MEKMKIFLGTDHAGFELKEHIKHFLIKRGYSVVDCGAKKYDADDDYPDFILPTAKNVCRNSGSRGIIFGGSGQGEAIVANRVKGIRAAVYYGHCRDIIRLSREHNDANILSIGSRFVSNDEAENAIISWLETDFSNEGRHSRRISKIESIR